METKSALYATWGKKNIKKMLECKDNIMIEIALSL